jgi:hypothetical protein
MTQHSMNSDKNRQWTTQHRRRDSRGNKRGKMQREEEKKKIEDPKTHPRHLDAWPLKFRSRVRLALPTGRYPQ